MAKNLAHITEIGGKKIEQSVLTHSLNVANYAADKLKSMNLYHTAYLAGLLHDMGKCTGKYQNYLEKASRGENVVKGSVNHTFCGCIYLLQHYHTGRPQGFDTMTCEILAYTIGSHHGEFDCVTLENTSGFEHRLNKDAAEISYDEAVRSFLAECASSEEIDRLFLLAQNEITALFQAFKACFGKDRAQISFLMGLTARMVLSAVIDGDRRDTAEFMSGSKLDYRDVSKALWSDQTAFFEKRIASFAAATPINRARNHFSEQCRDFAQNYGGGIYRLTLPTGAGKTLSALRYALYHAKTYGKKRILFVIPLLSILEQNSAVIRSYIQDQSILTEHHSNVVKTFETVKELDRYELLTETWESPIIITTLVQLLNTLFSDKTTAIRRMSALSNAIIVIDEIQSLPKKTTNMFTMALNFLAYACGATIVLSSATQPCFDETVMPLKYSVPADIVPYEKESFEVFKRTKIVDKTSPYGISVEELTDFSADLLKTVSSLLIICNTKESALKLYIQLKQQCSEYRVFHLSASMCMAHRTDTLVRINSGLKNREKTLCISTQLVEAGVDFSFESVIRVAAGMDNIAQASGRCNRSNDFGGICTVYVVNFNQDAEKLGMLHEIEAAQRCAGLLLHRFTQDPKPYAYDLLSAESMAQYYQFLFNDIDIKGKFSYPQKLSYGTTENLFDLLADNRLHMERPEFKGRYFLNQSFKTAGECFKVFDENTTEVIVPYNAEAKEIIADLFSQKAAYDAGFLKACIEKAKPYTVQIFEYQNRKLQEYGMLSSENQGHFTVLNEQCYNAETGLVIENFIF
ncbi:CRISPR-associated helicase Cas3' [Caproiciproducens faecalis]|uniref:CRISPR-associated helicase Cas3 n=1 Tax=Caproiciproducens faecalis TaxID=2820301 RepID=A0ABS7DJN3_9FIRM|nr:CRISPR-associated helicase Cas3' [Caproiciproducens faecalis]MBW7571492.1 CRISPR-associated helicase Cas3' [Caproiciproducens faecalis]